jgi:hypothetical protein
MSDKGANYFGCPTKLTGVAEDLSWLIGFLPAAKPF